MTETIPYTYLIGRKNLNKRYYGVRFAKGCSPKDLFVKYFTSSSRVHSLIEVYGTPNVIQIRKTFNNSEEAILWEQKVLNRIDIKKSHWINSRKGNGQYVNKGGYKLTKEQRNARKGRSPWNKGIPANPISIEIGAAKRRGKAPRNKGIPMPEEQKQNQSIKMSGENNPMYGKSAVKGRKRYTNGINSVYTFPGTEPEGYYQGRLNFKRTPNKKPISLSTRNKHSKRNKGNCWFNNGYKEIFIKPTNVPEGYRKGRLKFNRPK